MSLLNQYKSATFTYGNFTYNYQEDLSIGLSWIENFAVLMALSTFFYTMAFILLKQSKTQVSVWYNYTDYLNINNAKGFKDMATKTSIH